MKKALLIFVSVLILSSCSLLMPSAPSVTEADLRETVHWMVDDEVMAVSTQIMYELRKEMQTLVPPTAAATPTPESVMKPTVTSIWQANRDDSEYILTQTPLSCINKVKFVQDITIKDGERVIAGKPFTKTWLLRNVGTCTWTDAYHFVFEDGSLMGGEPRVDLPAGTIVYPDQSLEVAVYMIAPEKPGTYTGYWMIEDSSGNRFGTGDTMDKPIWVKVEVR